MTTEVDAVAALGSEKLGKAVSQEDVTSSVASDGSQSTATCGIKVASADDAATRNGLLRTAQAQRP